MRTKRTTTGAENFGPILEGIPEAVIVEDSSGQMVYANEAAVRGLGFGRNAELVGADLTELRDRFEILDQSGLPMDADRMPGRLALAGTATADTILRLRNLRTGEEQWASVTAWPVFGEGGERFAVSVFVDVTARRRQEESLRERVAFLSGASELLSSSLDYETTGGNVARLAVPRLADWCIVYLIQRDGRVRRVAMEHADPSRADVARSISEDFVINLSAPEGVSKVLRTGRSELHPEADANLVAADVYDSDQLAALLEPLGITSWMCVPIAARSRVLGAISFVSTDSGRHYDAEDLALAEDMARRASSAMDNARLFEERSHIARTLQHSLLPPQLPDIPGIEIAARFRPTGEGNEVGGDFYDLFETAEGDWAIVIGDVCGKGADAAALTGLSRHTIRAAAMQEHEPSKVLAMLNEAIVLQDTGRFCTVAYARLEPQGNRANARVTGERFEAGMLGHLLRAQLLPATWVAPHARLTVSCGGHPLPVVLRAGGPLETIGEPGTLLGIYPDPQLTDHEVFLGPGDAVVLYTDGVSEELDPTAGPDRSVLWDVLMDCVGLDASAIAERVEREAIAQQTGSRDDMAILVVRIAP